jgi:methyltransferase-like protein/SAM-dependent methyltransferase
MSALSSYDDLVYPSFPYPQTHPSHLATVARMFGLVTAPPESCRVLELGCAGGGNLLPMAEQFPGGEFVGIDLSARQIELGQQAVRDLGLSNLSLRRASILDVTADWGRFDYVVCHGVYSWVPDEVRDKILAICRENLAPHGVAYVSYNTYPGWHMRGMLREIMCFHAARFAEPREQVRQARSLLAFLAEASTGENNPYNLILRQEAQLLGHLGDSYLFHEHLEEHNDPCYFFEFAQLARQKGLQYLGDAAVSTMLPGKLPAKVADTLRGLASDLYQMEQYLDFVRNRVFRTSLLCHGEVEVVHQIDVNVVREMHLSSPLTRGAAADSGTVFQAEGGGTVTSLDPTTTAVLDTVGRAWPASVSFDRLTTELVAAGALPDTPEARARLASVVMQLFVGAAINVSVTPSRGVSASERPAVTPLARYTAARDGWAPTLRHGMLRVDDFGARMIAALDGTRNRDGIAEALVEAFRNKRLRVQDGDKPVEDVSRARELIRGHIPTALETFARKELLVG